MNRSDLRRLAALDLHGRRGSRRRRLVILAEFFGSALIGLALGAFLIFNATPSPSALIGVALVGIGVNYLPLCLQAAWLVGGDRLEAELAALDLSTESRRSRTRQLWLLIPFAVAFFAMRD